MSLLDTTRSKCQDMQYDQVLEYLEQGYSIKFAAEQLGIPYSRALNYHKNLEFLDELKEEGEDSQSIVHLDIRKSFYLELRSYGIKTISDLYNALDHPEDFDIEEILLNKINLLVNSL